MRCPIIREIFWEEEADLISGLPVSRYRKQDRMIWRPTSSGEFSVRSAYYLELERNTESSGGGSKQSAKNAIWQTIWELRVPNATKVFIWRACNNILPTKENLKRRGVLEESNCILCTQDIESVGHALWHCPTARDVWCISERAIQKCVYPTEDFFEILEALSNRCTAEELAIFASTARRIWSRRNEVTHGGMYRMFQHPCALTNAAVSQWRMWEKTLEIDEDRGDDRNLAPEPHCRWMAPDYDTFKTNWDVAVKMGSKRLGVGIIVRDFIGQVCAASCQFIEGSPDPTVGEAMGALCALEFCRDLGFQNICLEGDSKVVVQAINRGSPWCCFGQILEDIHTILLGFRRWRVDHVRREANEAAHGLAKVAGNGGVSRIWMEETPDIIHDVVVLEQFALGF